MLLCVVCRFLMVLLASSTARAEMRTYQAYPFDKSPFTRHADIAKTWLEIREEWTNKPMPLAVIKRHYDIVQSLAKREPKWIEGYWLASQWAYLISDFYFEPKDNAVSRAWAVQSLNHAQACLDIQADNVMCRFFWGVSRAKIAGFDGVISSLRHAKEIEDIWLGVTESPYDFNFTGDTTLQGAVRFALGIYYRVIPPMTLLKWLFGVRGDIEKSIGYHRENLIRDKPKTCGRLMFAAALLCSVRGDKNSLRGREAFEQLALAKEIPTIIPGDVNCAKVIPKLEQDTGLACGLGPQKQEEYTEEGLQPKKN